MEIKGLASLPELTAGGKVDVFTDNYNYCYYVTKATTQGAAAAWQIHR